MGLTKKELGEYIASNHNFPKGVGHNIVDDLFKVIANELNNGGEVAIHGFGKFVTSKRSAREGRNPATGAPVQIEAKTMVKFKPSANLKEQVN